MKIGKTSGIIPILKRVFSPRMRSRKKLFDKDGWGPNNAVGYGGERVYRGPKFPAPLHPLSVENCESRKSQLCNDARVSWARRDFRGAERLYREALREDPKSADVLFELAQLLWLNLRMPEAEKLLNQAYAADPNHYQSMVSLSVIDRLRYAVLVPRLLKVAPSPPEYLYYSAVRRIAGRY